MTENRPTDANEAQRVLEDGNAKFATLDNAKSDTPGKPIAQTPFAVVLGCSDARAPIESIFQRSVNDIFVVRVAGNVLGNECLGSIEYAVAHLASVRVVAVLGHSGCGAVTATVDTFLEPSAAPTQGLRSILGSIYVSVQAASMALTRAHGADVTDAPGFRAALIETAIVGNAALQASTVRAELDRDVLFGVYDLVSHKVHVPQGGADDDAGMLVAPSDVGGLRDLILETAKSEYVTSILKADD